MEPEILQTVQSFTAHVPLLKSITMKLTQIINMLRIMWMEPEIAS